MNRIKTFFFATRPQFFPAVIIPVLLGASTAWHYERLFSPLLFILTTIAALFYHAGMNTLNDYFDNLNNTDNINKNLLTPFTGGSRMIQRGQIQLLLRECRNHPSISQPTSSTLTKSSKRNIIRLKHRSKQNSVF